MLSLKWALLSLLFFGTFGTSGTSLPKMVVPNFPSFKMKTRVTFGTQPSSVHTLYMLGARTRAEYDPPTSGPSPQLPLIILTQCDQKRNVAFDPQHKTFTEWPIVEWSDRIRKHGVRQPEATGPEISVAMDSVDTGERRQVGPYLARHVKTTTRIEPGTNSTVKPRLEESDGWYIDIPTMNCEDWGDREQPIAGWLTVKTNERIHVSHTGSGKRGYTAEEVGKMTAPGLTYETRVELLEASSDALNSQLFDLPPGYAHALQSPLGTDYSRPDTLSNRAAAYWTYFRQSMARAFRSPSGRCKPACPPVPSTSL